MLPTRTHQKHKKRLQIHYKFLIFVSFVCFVVYLSYFR